MASFAFFNAGTRAVMEARATQAPNHQLTTATLPAAPRTVNPVNMQRQVE